MLVQPSIVSRLMAVLCRVAMTWGYGARADVGAVLIMGDVADQSRRFLMAPVARTQPAEIAGGGGAVVRWAELIR